VRLVEGGDFDLGAEGSLGEVKGTRQWRSLPWRGMKGARRRAARQEVARVAAVGAGLAFAGETQARCRPPRPADIYFELALACW